MSCDHLGHAVDDGSLVALIVGADHVDARHDLLHLVGLEAAGGDHGGADAHAAGDRGFFRVAGDGVFVQGDVVFIAALLQLLPGISAGNPILGYATDNALLPKVLFMVILAPVIEEYIFRKQLIDRMHIYGEKLAVVTSALMFGLFHGNLSQFFYAFALGLVFGYVYLKTGKLRYSIGLHILINLIGSVIGPFFLEKIAVVDTMETMDLATLEPVMPWLIAFGAYVLVLIGLAITGLVLLCINKRRVSFAPAELELPKESRFKTVYVNVGMILLILGCAALIISNVMML